jgi:hypothetical protein
MKGGPIYSIEVGQFRVSKSLWLRIIDRPARDVIVRELAPHLENVDPK